MKGVESVSAKFLVSLVTLVLCDALLGGLSLLFLDQTPDLVKGLPVSQMGTVAHPYKAYALAPGSRFFGQDSTMVSPLTGKPLDYRVGEQGTVVDDFGHQMLPEHLTAYRERKRSDEIRMLFLGGSTTFLPWPFHLAERLNQRFDRKFDFVTINAGSGGYTSQENVIDLLISGFSYQPDLVIAYLPVNDIYWAAHYPDFKRDYTQMRVPFQLYDKAGLQTPTLEVHSYPFARRLYDIVLYRTQLAAYRKTIDLASYTTRQPDHNGELVMDRSSFERTVEAVIDNVFTMKTECAARGVKFILVTQKLFSTTNPYYTFMDRFTYEAIGMMKRDRRLSDVHMVDLGEIFPDSLDGETLQKLEQRFHRTFDPGQEMAYDSMHLSPNGNYLFAMILEDVLEPDVRAMIRRR